MRRAFVLFLVLLFPLNVLALALSVATVAPQSAALQCAAPDAAGAHTPDSLFAGMFDTAADADIDPDEPPALDLHDIVNHEAGLQSISLPGRTLSCHHARRQRHSIPPPVKPPRHA